MIRLCYAVHTWGLPWVIASGLLTLLCAGLSPSVAQTSSPTPESRNQINQPLLEQPGTRLSPRQLSPNQRLMAVTLTPAGTETARFAQTLLLDAQSGQQLASLPGHSPRWDAAGLHLTVQTAEEEIVYDVTTGQKRHVHLLPAPAPTVVHKAAVPQFGRPRYPTTIRVIHHPNNGCRSVADWQIDVIPFEDYVARSVPAEMPVSWPIEALKAQAVAARTYAWLQILQNRPDYDVTDWANFQMMCDARFAASDTAVAATAGRYLTTQDDVNQWPILAMYSARNGHPTLTNPELDYLQAVPDLFSLGEVRWGHGYGLSQWGALRRAQAGHTYLQILAHYYTNVRLIDVHASSTRAGFVTPLPGEFLASAGLRWHTTAVTADGVSTVKIVAAKQQTVLTETAGIWLVPPSLGENSVITAELWLNNARQEQVTLLVDRTPPPPPTWSVPGETHEAVVPVVANAAPDAQLAVRQSWLWEGEELLYTADSGHIISDSRAHNGLAWQALAQGDGAGVWYGPYTKDLLPGYRYRALFWLRASHPITLSTSLPVTPVARLDVTDRGGVEVLGLRDIWLSDFRPALDCLGDGALVANAGERGRAVENAAASAPLPANLAQPLCGPLADEYSPVAVDFHIFEVVDGVEFRVQWPGEIDLALDRVEVWQLPPDDWREQSHLLWQLHRADLHQPLYATSFDAAGNMSPPVSATITLLDIDPPVMGIATPPPLWISSDSLTVSVPISDAFSGLDTTSGRLLSGDAQITATFSAPADPWQAQQLTVQTEALPEGRHSARLHAADRAGNVATSALFSFTVDLTPPSITATTAFTPNALWYAQPVTVTLTATDSLSGVDSLLFAVNDGPAVVYDTPILLATGGPHRLIYWATDRAGNVSTHIPLTVTLDLAAPTVALSWAWVNTDTVRLQWAATDDGSGVAQVTLQIRYGDEEWKSLLDDAVPESGQMALPNTEEESEVWVRVRAIDRAGRMRDWVEVQLFVDEYHIYLPVVAG